MFIGVCQFDCRCGKSLQTDNSGYVECRCGKKYQVQEDEKTVAKEIR